MARKKTPHVRVSVKESLSRRLKDIRHEQFGEHGGPELARRLNLPARTWYNYETGVTVPAEVLLGFIEQTGANPIWLYCGQGSRYRDDREERLLSQLSSVELIRRGLEKLEREPAEVTIVAPEDLPERSMSDFVAVPLVALEDLPYCPVDPSRVKGYIMAYRQWLPNPSQTAGVRLDDDAMHPILPGGSIVAVDRSVRDPFQLQGKMVAAQPDGVPCVRWLDLSGRHVILRPNQPSKIHHLVPVEIEAGSEGLILGQVVWSWSRFSQG